MSVKRFTITPTDYARADITVGKVYDAEGEDGEGVFFRNDKGYKRYFYYRDINTVSVQKLDTVEHPSHYGGDTTYEAIKVIENWQLGFNLGNVAKYISRAGKKSANTVEDLKKAAFYLNREIANLEA